MSQVNYAAMSDQELRQYFLLHREDKMAIRVYLDRLSDVYDGLRLRPPNIITTVDDPDFDAKIQAAVIKQIQAAGNNGEMAI